MKIKNIFSIIQLEGFHDKENSKCIIAASRVYHIPLEKSLITVAVNLAMRVKVTLFGLESF